MRRTVHIHLNYSPPSSKAPTQNQKFKTLQKLILSHFHNVTHILSQLTDEDTLRLALSESAKLIPYIINSRKAVKAYLKVSHPIFNLVKYQYLIFLQ